MSNPAGTSGGIKANVVKTRTIDSAGAVRCRESQRPAGPAERQPCWLTPTNPDIPTLQRQKINQDGLYCIKWRETGCWRGSGTGTVRGEETYGWSISDQMSQSIASKRDIAVLATVFVDLEYVQQQPYLADGLDRTQRTVNQSLHVVPYYTEKAPSFGDSESVMSTPGLYQARQWRKSQVLDGVSAAMARGRWQISVRNYQRALSQLVSMVELPCRFFMVCGYLILPAAWCLLQWVVPSGCVRPWELQRYSRPDRGWIMRREDVETPRWFRGLAVRWSGVCRHYFLLLQLFWDATGWGSMESALRCCHHGWWRC